MLSLIRPAWSTSTRKWRRLVWPSVLTELKKQGFVEECAEEVYLLRLTQLSHKNLETAYLLMDEGDVDLLRFAVFNDSWGLGGAYEQTLEFISIGTPDAVFLALFALRNYVDRELLRIVEVERFRVEQFTGRQLVFPV